MALNLGELSGIISLDEKPAMTALGKVRRGMQETANEGQKSTDKLQAQQARYAAAVENASAAVTRARAREKDAADGVRVAEMRLVDAKKKGVEGSTQIVAAEKAVRAAHERVRASHEATAKSTRDLELSQNRLATSFQKDTNRMSVDFHKMANTLSWDGTRTGRLVAKSFALIAVGATSVLPAVGALGAGVIAASGSVLTLAGSIKQLGGVAALAPAGLFALGSGAGVLMSAFSGMGEALKTANEATTATAGSAKLDAMTLADAAQAVARAERTSAEQRAAALRSVSDAQEQAAEQNRAAAERVTEAEERAAEARTAALRRVADAQKDTARVVEQNAEAQASALRRVEDATEGVEDANKRVLESEQDLSRARKEAAEQLLDLQSSLESASLSERAAVLNFQEAEEALRRGVEAGVSGTTREMQERQLAFDQADFALREARKRTQTLREEEAAAARAGVEGSGRVLDAQEALREAREGSLKAIEDQRRASADADKVQRENSERLADAKQTEADAQRDVTAAQVDGAKDVADARKAQARTERDSARSVADAVEDAARSQRDSVESVEDAYRSLERTQIQQAESAIKLTEKSVEAMGKLTPAAQAMAAALLIAYGRLGDVRDIAQENFFAGMDAPLLALVDTVIPQLERGVGRLAAAYGAGARTIIRALDRELGNGVLERMFDRSTEAAYILNDAIDPIVGALVTLTDVGMEYMPRFAGGIREAATEFDAFIQMAANDGSLRMWIDNGIEGTKDLFTILGSVLGILDKLEDAARAGGIATTLGSVADGLDRIEEKVSGPVFQSTMATIFAGARGGAEGLLAALGPIGEAFRVGGPALAEFLRLGGEIAGTFVGSMFTGLSDPNFGSGLTTFLGHVQDGVDTLGPKLPGLFSALGDMLVAVGPVVEAFGPTAVEVLTIFAGGLGAILETVEPVLTAFADSPAAVAAFTGVIAGTAVLGAMATFVGNIVGIRTAFGLMWAAATGPVGLVVAGILAAAGALTWFFTQTEVGRESIDTFVGQMNTAQAKVDEFTGNLTTEMGKSWSDFQSQMSTAQTNVDSFTNGLIEDFNNAQANVDGFTNGVLTKFGEFKTGMDQAQTKTDAFTSNLTTEVGRSFGDFKSQMDTAQGHVDSFTGGIEGFFGDMGSAVDIVMANIPGYFENAQKGAMLAWNLMRDEAKKPISFIIDTVINDGLIAAFRQIPGINEKNLPDLKVPGFATGGQIPGYSPSPTADNIPIMATAGEFMVRHSAAERLQRNHPGALEYINQYGRIPGIDGYATGGFIWPVGGQYPITQRPSAGHRAYDIGTPVGVPVKAAQDGRVALAGPGHAAPGVWGGTEVHLDHGGGVGSLYAHLSRLMVQVGDMVKQGQAIAASGNTGISSGPHLHFGALNGYNMVNPDQYLNGSIPGGAFGAVSGGTFAAPVNPFDGILDGLMGGYAKRFPGGGMFVDAAGGIAKSGISSAVKVVDDIKNGVAEVTGGLFDNIKRFFGVGGMTLPTSVTSMTPTLMDGGGWLHDTDGPQLVDHRRKKPDAFTPFDEWQQIKKDFANAQGPVIHSTIEYVGESPEQFADRERQRMKDMLDAYA